MKTAYTYTILRYVHDVAAGEFLNVGVVLLAPDRRYLEARLQTNFGRLKSAFPSITGEQHRELMRYLQQRFNEWQTRIVEELAYEPLPENAEVAAARILPKDDSSLQWSPAGGGLTSDPRLELNRLYERMVTANDSPKPESRRGDEVVWSVYRSSLAKAKVLPYLTPHKVTAEHDEVEFEHAWKNHHWHCLQPFSLDYLDADSIKAKAHRLLGQMIGVRDVILDHRLYLMVGEPQIEKCKAPAQRYLNLLLEALPLPTVAIRESDAESFSQEFAEKIRDFEPAKVAEN